MTRKRDSLDDIALVLGAAAAGAITTLFLTNKEAVAETIEDIKDLGAEFAEGLVLDLEHIAGNYDMPVEEPTFGARRKELATEFLESIGEPDNYTQLKAAVKKNATEVYRIGGDELLKAHATACVIVGERDLALKSFSRASKLSPKEAAVFGLLKYRQGRFTEAANHLQKVVVHNKYESKEWAPEAHLAYKTALDRVGPVSIMSTVHRTSRFAKQILEGCEDLAGVSEYRGAVAFNEGHYLSAEKQFAKAREERPTEGNWLNELTAIHASKRAAEAYGKLPEFYTVTGSEMTEGQVQNVLERRRMTLPRYELAGGVEARILTS